MTASSERKTSYRKTEIPWLAQVPTHWTFNKLRSLLHPVNNRGETGLPLLSVTREKGVIKRNITSKDENHNYIPEDLSNYKVVKNGQFAVNKMKSWQGSYGVSKYDGLVSPAYFVFDLDGVNPDFFHHAIRSKAYVPFFWQASDGIRVDQWDLSTQRMKEISFLVPPLEEQNAIVRYLDHLDRLVKHYVRAKHKEIQLLEELKQITIYLALTKGVYENGNCVESGVDWIGETPEHWETRTIKSCLKDITTGIWGNDLSDSTIEKRIICIRVADFDVRHLSVNTNNFTYRSISHTALSSRILERGDILIEKSGGGDAQPVGRVVLFTIDSECVCSNFIVRLRPSLNIIRSQFLLYILFILQAQKRNLPSIKQTTGIQNLDLREYFSNYISVPPLEEQDAIIEFIKEQFNMIETNIEVLNNQIAKVNLYQSRLISDIVTGKIAVTNLTAEEDQFTVNIDMGYGTQFDETDEMLSMVDEEGEV